MWSEWPDDGAFWENWMNRLLAVAFYSSINLLTLIKNSILSKMNPPGTAFQRTKIRWKLYNLIENWIVFRWTGHYSILRTLGFQQTVFFFYFTYFTNGYGKWRNLYKLSASTLYQNSLIKNGKINSNYARKDHRCNFLFVLHFTYDRQVWIKYAISIDFKTTYN